MKKPIKSYIAASTKAITYIMETTDLENNPNERQILTEEPEHASEKKPKNLTAGAMLKWNAKHDGKSGTPRFTKAEYKAAYMKSAGSSRLAPSNAGDMMRKWNYQMKKTAPNFSKYEITGSAKSVKESEENTDPSSTLETTSQGYKLAGPTADGHVGLERQVDGFGTVLFFLNREDAAAIMAKFGSDAALSESKDGKKPANKSAKEMRQWNGENKTPAYTKEEHSKGSGLNAYEMAAWNISQDSAGKYSKKEHKNAKNCNLEAKISWNRLKAGSLYTKAELGEKEKVNESTEAKPAGKSAKAMRYWNMSKTPRYTKAEHKAAAGINAREMTAWNIDRGDTVKYSKAEHKKADGFDKKAMEAWNRLKAGPAYTKAELEGSK